jgi:16S rRNA (cytidine1402-2'-O)-methyltransferase
VKGSLYLIPSLLGNTDVENVIPKGTLDVLLSLRNFVVEDFRSARRYLSKAGFKGRIDELEFIQMNKHTDDHEREKIIALLENGISLGVISEAGLPAVADPGSRLVEMAHKKGIDVIPLTGPSSLMLALMASGKNGQSFAFTGYLPIKSDERRARIRELERLSVSGGQSQIMIETPYRNDALMADFLHVCSDNTLLTVAAEITTENSFIRTKSVGAWKKNVPQLNKKPCVFVL